MKKERVSLPLAQLFYEFVFNDFSKQTKLFAVAVMIQIYTLGERLHS
jgi:hypothetical protein